MQKSILLKRCESKIRKLTEDENVSMKPNPKISKAKFKEPVEIIFKLCVKDCEVMYKLYIASTKIKKCGFETHSEGLLRGLRQIDYNLYDTMKNLLSSWMQQKL